MVALGKKKNILGLVFKCGVNVIITAGDIIPWLIPERTDFQSRHTLYLLHE